MEIDTTYLQTNRLFSERFPGPPGAASPALVPGTVPRRADSVFEAQKKRAKRERAYARTEGKCAYCGGELPDNWHIEHIMPKSAGGSNEDDNLFAACPLCNRRKHDRSPEQWRDAITKRVIEHLTTLEELLTIGASSPNSILEHVRAALYGAEDFMYTEFFFEYLEEKQANEEYEEEHGWEKDIPYLTPTDPPPYSYADFPGPIEETL